MARKQLTANARYARVVKWARLAGLAIDDITVDPNGLDKPSARTSTGSSISDSEVKAQSEDASGSKDAGADDPWDHRFVSKTVNWEHDLEVDPPPF